MDEDNMSEADKKELKSYISFHFQDIQSYEERQLTNIIMEWGARWMGRPLSHAEVEDMKELLHNSPEQ